MNVTKDGITYFDNMDEAQRVRVKAWEAKATRPEMLGLSFYAGELLGEIGEAANVIKKLEREAAGAPGSTATIEQLGEEIADALICLRNLAIVLDVEANGPYPAWQPALLRSDWSVAWARALGQIMSHLQGGTTHMSIEQAFSQLRAMLRVAALQDGIDITTAEMTKWNITSSKLNFPYRVVKKLPSVSLEETFK